MTTIFYSAFQWVRVCRCRSLHHLYFVNQICEFLRHSSFGFRH